VAHFNAHRITFACLVLFSSAALAEDLALKQFSKEPLIIDDIFSPDDRDGDAINNADDFCPEINLDDQNENYEGINKIASIIYFDIVDTPTMNFFQDTMRLGKAFQNYDYRVLLYDRDSNFAADFLSQKAINAADQIYQPSQENFYDALRWLIQNGYMVDLWIFSHGNPYGYSLSDGYLLADEIEDYFSPENTGCPILPIRLVYSIACFGDVTNSAWRSVGAKVTVGTPSIDFYPTQFSRFADSWTSGEFTAAKSAKRSNTKSTRTWSQLYLEWEALFTLSGEGPCGLIPNVLGQNDCALWYFTNSEGVGYNIESDDFEYDIAFSGKINMNRASEWKVRGDRHITFDTRLVW